MRALGYDTTRLKLSAFVLAGALAGVGGALSGWSLRFVSTNDVGIPRSIEAFVSVLIGGTGRLVGPAVGAGVGPFRPPGAPPFRPLLPDLAGRALHLVFGP